MRRIEKGSFEVINPYNRHVSIHPATPDNIHTIVFWSKNFGPFIKGGFGEKLVKTGYNLFFNFTINSDSPLLEPNVPFLKERLDQLDFLSSNFGARSINWRFDPVCFYKTKKQGGLKNNLKDFLSIADKASESGVKRCITSFMDHYPKILKRLVSMRGFSFIDPPMESKKNIVRKMAAELKKRSISLRTCCEKELLDLLPATSGVTKSSCIPNDLLVEIFGGHLSLKRDMGQRVKNGCGCMVSVDIGTYQFHPCYHNCLFCYANPVSGGSVKSFPQKTQIFARKG